MKKLKLFFLLTALCFSTISRPIVTELFTALGVLYTVIQNNPTLKSHLFTENGAVNLPTLYVGWDFLTRGINYTCKKTDTCLGRIFPRWWQSEENIKKEKEKRQQEEHDDRIRLEEENKRLLSEMLRLQSEKTELESKCSYLNAQLGELSITKAQLETILKGQNKELDTMCAQEREKATLTTKNATLTTEIEILKKQIEEKTKYEKIINDLKTKLAQKRNNANTEILKQELYQYKYALSLFYACAVFQKSKSQRQKYPQLQTGTTWPNNIYQDANLFSKKTGSTVPSFFPKPDTPSVTYPSGYLTNRFDYNEPHNVFED